MFLFFETVKSCEGFEILCKLEVSLPQLCRCWKKTRDSCTRDKRLHYSQKKSVSNRSVSVFVLVPCIPVPRGEAQVAARVGDDRWPWDTCQCTVHSEQGYTFSEWETLPYPLRLLAANTGLNNGLGKDQPGLSFWEYKARLAGTRHSWRRVSQQY